jgi:3-methyladenine DNA glycosylase AlkD
LTFDQIIQQLQAAANPEALSGMARFGIQTRNTLGISMPVLRQIAKGIHDHTLAEQLWASGLHEARILASLVDQPKLVTAEQMERWVLEFDSWDVVDQTCINLFVNTPFAVEKAVEWSARPEEFVKRAGFVLMAVLAVHAKRAPDELFLGFLPIIAREAGDGRNFVKKAVNWALRSIGKRSPSLRQAAVQTAEQIQGSSSPSARWVAADALRELERGREPRVEN